jgi:DNA-binding transcriptional MerR regulator
MGEQGYRGPQVCKIVGITYRQLDYWARTDLIRPSLADAKGSGTQRMYSYRDLVELKVIKSLLDAGVKLPKARTALEYLREHLGEDLATANLVMNGTGSILARNGDELVDILRNGQTVFSVVALSGVQEEVDAAIRDLRPVSAETDGGATPAADDDDVVVAN